MCFKLTLEYCLRRLKRCTILTHWLTDGPTAGPPVLLLSTDIPPKYTPPHIVHSTVTHTNTHTYWTHTRYPPLQTSMCTHISSPHCFRLLCKHKWGEKEREREKKREREMEKKGEGEQAEIKTAQLCCPLLIFTVIPWALSPPLTDTVTQDAHATWLSIHKWFPVHTLTQYMKYRKKRSYSHTCTHPSTSSCETLR